ncbi:GrdX family protein [Aerococcus sp. UMB10185]|uniref:GrdX family protein n=1 Tax=unclassified Aerococcus TaxID=2618060 RepID=UPI0008A2B532|nr:MULTISPECIES: GrdX family protein [unclassified Aerococcus]MDK6232748.1 GrdX family protein [Aerococcus sp. UMB10185]MDK6854962.1 GrdX family protein [Aerococcus sp. UMB7533]MDK8501772.1 GrdX family protein [Aerococcus sp. UMB1112A]OFN02720.1 hypothetical protein HMPREF2626_02070 [Aerococcus sp. HMSC062A02]OHO45611.1 hypothetical protein HMPREF2705_04730 [Aerococcus sp. HMSC035B07]
MKYIIVSNNESLLKRVDYLHFVEGGFWDVLIEVRNLIHIGWRPLTHPLPASLRMMLSPVRSVILADVSHDKSYEIIEQSMDLYQRTLGERQADFKNLTDYQRLDQELLMAALADL